jgi:hypothetical protein
MTLDKRIEMPAYRGLIRASKFVGTNYCVDPAERFRDRPRHDRARASGVSNGVRVCRSRHKLMGTSVAGF